MPKGNEVSGKKAREIASRVLADPNATADAKTLAGSVLSQSPDQNPAPEAEGLPAPRPGTRTYAILRVAPATWEDIAGRLRALDERIGQGPNYERDYIKGRHIVFGDVGLEAE